MSQSLYFFLLCFACLMGMLLLGAWGCASPDPTNIAPKETKGMIDFNTMMLILDVREPNEYCGPGGHLPGARNYPWTSGVLQERYRELPPQAPIIIVCRSGRRSRLATEFLRSRGYHRVLNMAGGMKHWQWETENCEEPNEVPG